MAAKGHSSARPARGGRSYKTITKSSAKKAHGKKARTTHTGKRGTTASRRSGH
jgi:hypothetical protein